MSAPISSYATAGIALWVSGALKPHHHDKVETPSVGTATSTGPANHWASSFGTDEGNRFSFKTLYKKLNAINVFKMIDTFIVYTV
jgi:hypothetical protein